jgi:MFS family permease
MSNRLSGLLLLVVIYAGFISLGLPDGTLGVAWPEAYPELGVPVGIAGTLMTIITSLAALSGFLSGRVIARFGTGPVVLASCLLTGCALVTLSEAQGLAWLYGAGIPLGLGAGAVDAGLNGFVARHYSGRHMNWLHACWGIGASSGPLVMGWAIAAGHGWRGGYATLGVMQLALAMVFLATLSLWTAAPQQAAASPDEPVSGQQAPAARLHSAGSLVGWLSPALFAVYVAAEMTLGVWAGSTLVVARGYAAEVAAWGTALYFGGITVGRITTGFIVAQVGNRRCVHLGAWLALASALGFALAPTVPIALTSLGLLGLGFAPLYPCLMHEVPKRFQADAVQTVIGRQSGGAYVGAALVPAAAGALASWSLNAIPWLVVAVVAILLVGVRELDRRS